MLRAPLLAVVLALAAPAAARAAGEVYTLAGAGYGDAHDGALAAFAGLDDPAPVAALPGGGFLVGTEDAVWRVDPQGRLHPVAGQGEGPGYTGDDGPALAAEVRPDHLAVLPGGGFLLADEDSQRVRMVAPDGTITTVAGGGTATDDGVPALRAAIARPAAIAALPGGGFAVDDDGERIRVVGPDGLIRTVAGGGSDPRIHGEPASAAQLNAPDLTVAADGTLLLADAGHGTVDRVAADGTIAVVARPPRGDGVAPVLVTALPGGGFAFAATDPADVTGRAARVYRAGPVGVVRRVAGGGPFAAVAPLGLAQRVDGGPATGLALPTAAGLSALPDGGLLFTYEPPALEVEGDVVAYVAPESPDVLAAALRRDGARVFGPGRPDALHLALTRPATVTLTAGGHAVTRALPAGDSMLPLPRPLTRVPHTVTLVAADGSGRRAFDRARVFPAGWLPDETARLVVNAVVPDSAATECRRFGGGRVDCEDEFGRSGCRAISVRFAHARLSWGAYRCALRAHPRYTRAPRRLRRGDWHCGTFDPLCRPALFGPVPEARLVPAD